ncbi:sensor histidine kinase [Magnetospirillum gryphiswaldense]|nr:ATP-binding protein [Magnetospirillum gryphiswaldense]AVM73482.1 Phytochrome-like protein cph1 [Magnetospirillum gryphiswaldense MSR-1]AVM77385.1 Phytochrome-like protein cph1 [Magnetospirillum gryphiswaldense]
MTRSNYSIFTVIGLVIVSTVAAVMIASGVANFLYAKSVISAQLREHTEAKANTTARSVAPYMQAYAVNDYLGILAHEMEEEYRAITVRDIRMAELTGQKEFVSGKVRVPPDAVTDYDQGNPSHRAVTANCFHTHRAPVLADTGQVIGEVTVCASDQLVQRELERTIRNSAINLTLVATILIVVLFLVISRVVIAPITGIAASVSRVDQLGIPINPAAMTGAREIVILASGFNQMVAVIRASIEKLDQNRRELERHQLALSAADQAQREIIWGTHAGTWEWNVETGETKFNERWAEILGYSLSELQPVSIATWLRFVHPQDQLRSEAELKQCFLGEREFYECECRMRHKSGEWVWVLDRGKVVEWTAHGQPLRMSGIHLDITERKQAEAERERIKNNLQRSNEDLEQFSYAISHDLQTPLRNVSSFLQLLQRRCGSQISSDANEYIEFAVSGAKHMSEMIHSLLEYSRVSSQGQTFEPMELDDALRVALQDLSATLAEKNATVTADPLPRIMGDPLQLARLFQNLIGNAVKYHPPDAVPKVAITVQRMDEEWEIAVTDNGIGIPPDQIEQLFKVFRRLHTSQEYEGHGVGLAVCKRIVMRHGGRIWAESEGAGHGSRFVFTLPAMAQPIRTQPEASTADGARDIPTVSST